MQTKAANTWGNVVSLSPDSKTTGQSSSNSGMDKLRIRGGHKLNGEINVSGAKNAALKHMCAALLSADPIHLNNMPNALRDIASQTELLTHLGCVIGVSGDMMMLNAGNITSYEAPYDIVRKMRASILVLGPLLARFGEARVSLPGGCAIGARAVDMHIKGLEAMGATMILEDGYINATVPAGENGEHRLSGTTIDFPKVSVGATENLLMAATLAIGTTTLNNAAKEPEIVDLGECLINMGAKIEGLGTSTITIQGVKTLGSATHSVLPDRIETGTYMIAVAMTGGTLRLKNARLDHLTALVEPLQKMGVDITEDGSDIIVARNGANLVATDITTAPYPAFPTDLQAQFMAMLTLAQGTSTVTETIFENRFMHVPELVRMGANISVQDHTATITGVEQLKGAEVMATDLRASVALVLAGLLAEGDTHVNRIYHLERGYENIAEKLGNCGADITKVSG